ncbi:MAG: DUF1707 SHOCT-like domain-containing protein [Nocardioidaceae bacterium]
MSSSDAAPWAEFTHDPRRSETRALRASDQDRDVVLRVLGEGYADGRLDREEYDERATATTQARTLGDLPPIIADLVPQVPETRGSDLVRATPQELDARAVAEYQASRRRAFSGMVIPSVVTFVIWFATSWNGGNPGFPWFLFVVLGTGVNLLRVLLHKQDIITEERQKLEKKRRKAIDPPPSDSSDSSDGSDS